jgi:DMSO/TMAO reductase YedYZ heme-binding membrane subunit
VRGQTNVSKLHTLKCAAYNLGLLLRKVWGLCKPRNAKVGGAAGSFAVLVLLAMAATVVERSINPSADSWWSVERLLWVAAIANIYLRFTFSSRKTSRFLTGC